MAGKHVCFPRIIASLTRSVVNLLRTNRETSSYKKNMSMGDFCCADREGWIDLSRDDTKPIVDSLRRALQDNKVIDEFRKDIQTIQFFHSVPEKDLFIWASELVHVDGSLNGRKGNGLATSFGEVRCDNAKDHLAILRGTSGAQIKDCKDLDPDGEQFLEPTIAPKSRPDFDPPQKSGCQNTVPSSPRAWHLLVASRERSTAQGRSPAVGRRE